MMNRITELLDGNFLTAHFQPIYSSKNGSVYGYEALTRINNGTPFADIGELFQTAKSTNTISLLDMRCRENAISQAAALGIRARNARLFINICPETLMDPAHRVGVTDALVERWGISKEKIVLEITEETAIHNYDLFVQTVRYYREMGYKIAIDDFGAGYAGLKMLSIIEPDYVKIDRYFVSGIDKAMVKFNLVDSIATACHRMGIKVLAEGIEQHEELDIVLNMGVELLQGFFLNKPAPVLNGDKAEIPELPDKRRNGLYRECRFIGDILINVEPIEPTAPVITAFNRFIKESELRVLPVVENEWVAGMLHRNLFLENQILGKYGYGFALNSHKRVCQLMEHRLLLLEANVTIEEVAGRISSRKAAYLFDDICVTQNGKYLGTVSMNALLDAIMEKNLIFAKGSNPLTGLPGNEFIQREIEKRLSQNIHFDVCYVDIDYFKPFNDHYGFARGDSVIKNLASIMETVTGTVDPSGFSYVGHIGGDDFLLITRPKLVMPICEKIISEFESKLLEFHGAKDYGKGHYVSKNRTGEEETFNLLSLSIGVVGSEINKIGSYAHLASVAAEVKKGAKMQTGSSILIDRRTNERTGL